MRLIISLLNLIIFATNAENECDQNGILNPDYWLNQDNFTQIGCEGSYYKLDLIPIENDNNYKITILDPELVIENENLTQTIHIHTIENILDIEVVALDDNLDTAIPFKIQYTEVKNTSSYAESIINTNSSINTELQPNSLKTYFLMGYDELQYYEMSWNFNNGLGFVALQNGNGRITLFTNPIAENMKVKKTKLPTQNILSLYVTRSESHHLLHVKVN